MPSGSSGGHSNLAALIQSRLSDGWSRLASGGGNAGETQMSNFVSSYTTLVWAGPGLIGEGFFAHARRIRKRIGDS